MPTNQMYSNDIDPINNFSEWLAYELKHRHISIAKLAKLSGVGLSTIYGYIEYKHDPSCFIANCIFRALGYSLEVVPIADK